MSGIITKEAIGAALKRLTKEKAFEDISVQDIAVEAGVSRKTFYNHFEDKYELVNWIFDHEMGDMLVAETTVERWPEGSLKLCRYLLDNKAYYTNVLKFEGQNSFKQGLYDLTDNQIRILVPMISNGKTISEDDMQFIVHFYYHAFVGELSAWVDSGMKASPEHIVTLWCGMVKKTLENFIDKFSE